MNYIYLVNRPTIEQVANDEYLSQIFTETRDIWEIPATVMTKELAYYLYDKYGTLFYGESVFDIETNSYYSYRYPYLVGHYQEFIAADYMIRCGMIDRPKLYELGDKYKCFKDVIDRLDEDERQELPNCEPMVGNWEDILG